MGKLNRQQRTLIGDKIMDSANLGFAGLVVGQMVTGEVDVVLLFVGLLLYFMGWYVSITVNKGVKRK